MIREGFNSTPLRDERGTFIGYLVRPPHGQDGPGVLTTPAGNESQPFIPVRGLFRSMRVNRAHLRRLAAVERMAEEQAK